MKSEQMRAELKVSKFVEKHGLISPGDRIIAGVSGGADSVCMLLILKELSQKLDFKLEAAHFNHKIREAAGEDAAFVKQLCGELGTEYHYAEEDVTAYAAEKGLSSEEAGRELRYRFLRSLGGKVAVAHTKNDSAETVLFNLFRGSGLSGLTGIRPGRDGIIRPILCLDRSEVEATLSELGRGYRTDETNLTDDYARNRIRHNILDYACKNICSNATERICGTAEIISQAEDYIREGIKAAAAECMDEDNDRVVIKLPVYGKLHDCIRSGVVHEAIAAAAGRRKDIGYSHIRAVMSVAGAGGYRKISLPYGLEAEKIYDTIVIKKAAMSGFPEEDDTELQGTAEKTARQPRRMGILTERRFKYNSDMDIPQNTYTKWFDCDKINERAVLRTRRSGDYLVINSLGQRKSLKDYMIEEKIPRPLRDRIPVLADGSHIMWVIGHRISEYYKTDCSTVNVIEFNYTDQGDDRPDL